MIPGARLAAAIEVFGNIETQRRPAAEALKDWGLAHRFAGSGDRSAIASLVYDALRRKASAAFLMDDATPRSILIGMLQRERGLDADAIAQLASGIRATRRRRSPTRSAPGSKRAILPARPPMCWATIRNGSIRI